MIVGLNFEEGFEWNYDHTNIIYLKILYHKGESPHERRNNIERLITLYTWE